MYLPMSDQKTDLNGYFCKNVFGEGCRFSGRKRMLPFFEPESKVAQKLAMIQYQIINTVLEIKCLSRMSKGCAKNLELIRYPV